jgi:phosphopantetheinyl transferase
MSKLIISLLNRNLVNAPNLFARSLQASSRRQSLLLKNSTQIRLLASSSNNQVTKSTEKTPAKQSASNNEFDKPQWERSDRFVSLYFSLSHFCIRVSIIKN